MILSSNVAKMSAQISGAGRGSRGAVTVEIKASFKDAKAPDTDGMEVPFVGIPKYVDNKGTIGHTIKKGVKQGVEGEWQYAGRENGFDQYTLTLKNVPAEVWGAMTTRAKAGGLWGGFEMSMKEGGQETGYLQAPDQNLRPRGGY